MLTRPVSDLAQFFNTPQKYTISLHSKQVPFGGRILSLTTSLFLSFSDIPLFDTPSFFHKTTPFEVHTSVSPKRLSHGYRRIYKTTKQTPFSSKLEWCLPCCFYALLLAFVRITGLEPARDSPLEPKSSASANSAISANK